MFSKHRTFLMEASSCARLPPCRFRIHKDAGAFMKKDEPRLRGLHEMRASLPFYPLCALAVKSEQN